jgi:hypothetical protein
VLTVREVWMAWLSGKPRQQTNSKNVIDSYNEFMKRYEPRINIVTCKKSDLLADFHIILNMFGFNLPACKSDMAGNHDFIAAVVEDELYTNYHGS